MGDNHTAHHEFETIADAADRWNYWERLNPKIRAVMQSHPVDFAIFEAWQLQRKYGVRYVLRLMSTRALELTVCDVPPLGVDYKWVINGETSECPVA